MKAHLFLDLLLAEPLNRLPTRARVHKTGADINRAGFTVTKQLNREGFLTTKQGMVYFDARFGLAWFVQVCLG